MATPHKSIFVPDEDKGKFDLHLAQKLSNLGMNFSEFVRSLVIDGELINKEDMGYYTSRESRKTGNYVYLVMRKEVEK